MRPISFLLFSFLLVIECRPKVDFPNFEQEILGFNDFNKAVPVSFAEGSDGKIWLCGQDVTGSALLKGFEITTDDYLSYTLSEVNVLHLGSGFVRSVQPSVDGVLFLNNSNQDCFVSKIDNNGDLQFAYPIKELFNNAMGLPGNVATITGTALHIDKKNKWLVLVGTLSQGSSATEYLFELTLDSENLSLIHLFFWFDNAQPTFIQPFKDFIAISGQHKGKPAIFLHDPLNTIPLGWQTPYKDEFILPYSGIWQFANYGGNGLIYTGTISTNFDKNFLVKAISYDPAFTLLEKEFGEIGVNEWAYSIIPTIDSSYLILGRRSIGIEEYVLLQKISMSGDPLWARHIPVSTGQIQQVFGQQVADRGFFLLVTTQASNAVVAIKTDEEGYVRSIYEE